MTNEKELLESIDHRLKMLLKLIAKETLEDHESNKEKVKLLHEMGFDTAEMAEMIGTTPGSVRGTRASLREEGEIDG
jgi:CRP-like cAMP-binding protein